MCHTLASDAFLVSKTKEVWLGLCRCSRHFGIHVQLPSSPGFELLGGLRHFGMMVSKFVSSIFQHPGPCNHAAIFVWLWAMLTAMLCQNPQAKGLNKKATDVCPLSAPFLHIVEHCIRISGCEFIPQCPFSKKHDILLEVTPPEVK